MLAASLLLLGGPGMNGAALGGQTSTSTQAAAPGHGTLRWRLQCADPADPSTCVQPLERDEPAPFAGQLVTREAALELTLAIERHQQLLDEAVRLVTETASVGAAADRQLARLELSTEREIGLLWEKRAHQLEAQLASPPFFERPLVVAIIAVVATTAVLGGAAMLANAAR